MSDVTEATITPVKKVAFMARPYESQDRIKKEEDEIEKLLEEQQSKNNEQTETQQDDDVELNAEEKTFKQRYSDLRRHQQKQADEYKNEILKLKEQLSLATKKEFKLPKTDVEIEQWAKQYPDVAAIVETIAMQKASEQQNCIDYILILIILEIVTNFTVGRKNSLNGFNKLYMKMILTHNLLLVLLIYIKQTRKKIIISYLKIAKMQLNLLGHEVKEVVLQK